MPTYATTARFQRDFDDLSPEEKDDFKRAVRKFVEDLDSGGPFRKGLRVKGVQGAPGVFEMTWGDNGRATFEYGEEVVEGEAHVIWRRCGGHEIFGSP
ncbi:MAG: hypothetical protein ACRDKA_10265 [Actinomycetota bacterium]